MEVWGPNDTFCQHPASSYAIRKADCTNQSYVPAASVPSSVQSPTCSRKKNAERDLSVRLWLKEVEKKTPSFMLTRMKGGTEFPMANILRHYFLEYASRISTHGPHSFPSSFNVVESFLIFSHDLFKFDLRDERDHLLRLYDYIDWYTAGPSRTSRGF